MKRQARLLSYFLLSALPLATASSQDSDDIDDAADAAEEPARCITLSRIDRTEVIDDRTIAFHMRNGDIYLNRLDRACRNLDRGRPFSYRTSTSQLCSVDVITILEEFGVGLSPGASCGLGLFEPSDEEELALLKGEEEPAEITTVPVE